PRWPRRSRPSCREWPWRGCAPTGQRDRSWLRSLDQDAAEVVDVGAEGQLERDPVRRLGQHGRVRLGRGAALGRHVEIGGGVAAVGLALLVLGAGHGGSWWWRRGANRSRPRRAEQYWGSDRDGPAGACRRCGRSLQAW